MKRYVYLSILMLVVVFIGVSLANMQVDNQRSNNNTASSGKASEITHTPVVTERATDRGQLLYENHCASCHDSGVHLRQSGKAHSVKDIRQWVIRWSKNLELDWTNNDVDVVTDYINRRFYQFNTEK